MKLLDLPMDILVLLPKHVHNIEDFMNASSSCTTLRDAFASAKPNTILRLAAASRRIFFRPDPHFLVAATVRQVSGWALESAENTETLRLAFMGGVDALLGLCLEKAGLTMDDIRRLHLMRSSTLNPVADLIDRSAGVQWYAQSDFWDGGASDAETIRCEPETAMYQIIIYGELFASTFQAYLEPARSLPRFGLEMRLDYIRYCVPDYFCARENPGVDAPKPVGIYAPELLEYLGEDQIALNHVLNCRRWREAWEGARRQVGGDFELEWKQDMWQSVVQCQGLHGLDMICAGGVDEWRQRLEEIRGQIEALEQCPKTYSFGHYENPATDYPQMAKEVFLLMAGYLQR